MKYNLFRKSLALGVMILLIGTGFVASSIPSISNNTATSESDFTSEYSVSMEQAKEMLTAKTAILLDVQEHYAFSYINGVMTVTLTDLECGSCIEEMFKDYENLIVYSKESALITQASQILRGHGYIVYELAGALSSDDFPLAYQISNLNIMDGGAELTNEGHSSIQVAGTTARVSAYKREERIKRLYGEAFSQGESPEESAETFLQANAHLFGVESSDLETQYLQPIMYNQDTGEYKFTGVNYAQYAEGIPVFRSRLILLVKNEEGYPLVHASVDLRDLGDFSPDVDPNKLNPEAGINAAQEMFPNLMQFTQPELIIWAGIDDMTVQPALAYSFIGDNGYQNDDSTPEKFLFVTDAETGDILYVENLIIFTDVTGNVQGKATQDKAADFCEDELAEDLMWARVNIGSEIAYADENGDFTIPNSGSSPVTVESRLWGEWFKVTNQAGTDTVLYETVTPPGPANFMHNNLNDDEYERAEVNGYYQANIVRDFTLTYNPSYPGLQQNAFPVKVNDNTGYCPGNAWYDGSSITFCRAGSGYPNTAWSTVIHHEYGHHLVAMAGSGQGQYGEGMGDVMGVLILDDPGTGWGFYGDCDTPLRNADNDIQYPCSGEIHYCGQLLSGCVWDTRNELEVTNPSNYIDILSNLAINAMLLHSGSTIDPSITVDYLVLDDDNGNIYDGTPHYWEIAAGFGAHNMDAPELWPIAFEFPDGIPDLIAPGGGTTVRVIVYGVTGEPEPESGILHLDDGSGWEEIPMTVIEPNVYDAIFAGGDCQDSVSFYFSAESTEGEAIFWPMGAPDEFFTAVFAYDLVILMEDDFETNLGWTVENSCSDGQWERGEPVGGGVRGDPPTDYDGSGQCYLTDNEYGNSDVDDGYTWLISPTIDLSDYENARVDYALWYTNNYGDDPNNDLFKVYVSDDNGANWDLADTIGPETSSGWKEMSFMVGDFVTPNSQVKVRFEASDLNAGSVVEAGIDAFKVIIFDCEPPSGPNLVCEGDLSWNGVNPGDTVTTTILVKNVGEAGSLLDWEITEWPTWGEWTFTPPSGDDLTPEYGPVTVQVEVVTPDQPNQEFTGEVKVVNKEDSEDFEILQVTLQTPRNRLLANTLFMRLLERFPNAFPLLRQLLGL